MVSFWFFFCVFKKRLKFTFLIVTHNVRSHSALYVYVVLFFYEYIKTKQSCVTIITGMIGLPSSIRVIEYNRVHGIEQDELLSTHARRVVEFVSFYSRHSCRSGDMILLVVNNKIISSPSPSPRKSDVTNCL